MGGFSLNSVLLLLLVKFVSRFRLELYIPHHKCPVKPHSSPWFSAACAVAIVHRNLFFFFRLHQQNKSSESEVKFRQANIVAKGLLKLPNLHVLIKQKNPSLPRNLALGTFGTFRLSVFSTKVNLLYLVYPTTRRCCLLHLIKQNRFLKTSLGTLILMTQVSLYLFSFLKLL